LREVAKMISEYHRVLEKSGLYLGNRKSDPLLKKQLLNEIKENRRFIDSKKKKSRADKLYYAKSENLLHIVGVIDSKKCDKLKQFPIHRDIGPENILWENRRISGIIDFENVGISNDVLVKDLAMVIQSALTSDQGFIDIVRAKYFIDEYRKHRSISMKEIELIPDIVVSIFIDNFNYSYWLVNNDSNRRKVKWIRDNAAGAVRIWNDREMIEKRLVK
jgi:Ser/Thr protein kinase RdoA (MazF antagonist)